MKNLIAALFIFAPISASAQQQCGPGEGVFQNLRSAFGEEQVIKGAAPGAVFHVLANNVTGTWTIVAVLPNGMACLVAAGESYFEFLRKPNT